MKVKTLTVVAAGSGVIAAAAIAFAVHFELSARARAYSELRGLRTETMAEVQHHRISPSQAAAIDRRLSRVRLQIEDDDVRGAQKLLDGVRAALGNGTRSA